MRLDYPSLIKESEKELLELERHHRYSHLMQRVKLLRLLKSESCQTLSQAAEVIDYSTRQCQRWLNCYRAEGLEALLTNRVNERGRQEWHNDEAWKALQTALEAGEIATYEQARALLAEHEVHYKDPTGVSRLFKRHGIKLKTGRPVHEKADPELQVQFKKTSPSV